MPIKLATRTKTYPVIELLDQVYGVANDKRTWSSYYPDMPDLSAQPIVVFIHGGGWTGGSKNGDTTWTFVGPYIARLGFVCYSINYTLATDVYPVPTSDNLRFPYPQQDCRSFLGYLGAGGGVGLGNGDVNKITMWGNSVGSQMALQMALAPKATFVEAENPSTNYTIVAAMTQCSPTNLLTMYNQSAPAVQPIFDHLGYDPNTNTAGAQLASPYNYVTSSSMRVYLQQGDNDQIVPYAQTTDLNAVFVAAGATMQYSLYPGVGHSASSAWTDTYNYVFTDRQNYLSGYGR